MITDHRPLVSLFNKPRSKPPARIERWILNLQQYKFKVEHEPGENNPADFPSRHPVKPTQEEEDKETREYVNFIVNHIIPKAMSIEEVELESAKDSTLQYVREAVQTGKWYENIQKDEKVKSYHRVKNDLTVSGNLVLFGCKIIIPEKLQSRVINIAHETHQGIVKTKALLREKVWFPGIDKMVENKIKNCLYCATVTPMSSREPLIMTPLPNGPFQEISTDFATVNDTTLLIVVDDYSRYPFAEIV